MTLKLAIDGGTPVRNAPLPPWPSIPEQDIKIAADVLRSGKINYWTGQEGKNFEQEFAEFHNRKYGIALANGTVALELALAAYGIGNGDEVIVTPRSFIASASCVITVGARPIFADIDPDSQNITAETIARAITPQTKAIIVVHLAGWPCDMDPIMELAKQKGLIVIEDCAQCHGARYKNKLGGSLGHIGVFSFCQDKIMTTAGEGGMVLTDDEKIWRYIWSYKDHGKSFDLTQKKHPPGFVWLHENFGTNLRMTEVQSALGRSALKRLDQEVELRRRNATALNEALKEFSCIRRTIPKDHIYHSYYKFYFFVEPQNLASGWSRDRIMQAISAEGVPCFVGSCSEVYLEKAFTNKDLGPKERLPVAKQLGETSLMLQVHPTITEADLKDIISATRKVLEQASAR